MLQSPSGFGSMEHNDPVLRELLRLERKERHNKIQPRPPGGRWPPAFLHDLRSDAVPRLRQHSSDQLTMALLVDVDGTTEAEEAEEPPNVQCQVAKRWYGSPAWTETVFAGFLAELKLQFNRFIAAGWLSRLFDRTHCSWDMTTVPGVRAIALDISHVCMDGRRPRGQCCSRGAFSIERSYHGTKGVVYLQSILSARGRMKSSHRTIGKQNGLHHAEDVKTSGQYALRTQLGEKSVRIILVLEAPCANVSRKRDGEAKWVYTQCDNYYIHTALFLPADACSRAGFEINPGGPDQESHVLSYIDLSEDQTGTPWVWKAIAASSSDQAVVVANSSASSASARATAGRISLCQRPAGRSKAPRSRSR